MAEISNLVFHAKCNNDTDSTIITDDSATANNGTLQGGDNTQDVSVAGKINKAFHLDGAADYGTFADNAAYNWTNKLSACAWVNADTSPASTDRYALSKYATVGSKREWAILLANATKKISIGYGDPADGSFEGVWQTDDDVIITAGTYYHVGFTFDGTLAAANRITIFINSVAVASGLAVGGNPQATIYNGTAPVELGSYGAGTKPYDGPLDDGRIYTKVLSQDEWDFIYNGGAGTEGNDPDVGGSVLTWEPEFCVMNGGFDV